MKVLIVSCLVAFACGDVSHIVGNDDKAAHIKGQELELSPEGGYRWSYELSNGIEAAASGNIEKIDAETSIQRVQGQSSHTAPDGQRIELTYVADENGFQPQGAHLPTPPPIPEAIIRALEYIRAHPDPASQKP